MKGYIALSGCVVLAWLCALASAAPAPKKSGHATPQDCFKAAKAAVKKGDGKAFTTCLTPASLEALAGGYVLTAALLRRGVPSESKVDFSKDVGKILSKYKIPDKAIDAVMKELEKARTPRLLGRDSFTLAFAKYVKDRAGFVAAMMALDQKVSVRKHYLVEAELKDVKVVKDRATATLKMPNHSTPITFVKGRDGWKMAGANEKK